MHLEIESQELHNVLKATNVYRDEAIIQLNNDGVMLRVQDESNTALYNTLLPESSMQEYEPGEFSRMGMHVEDMLNFTPNDDSIITIDLNSDGVRKFRMRAGTQEYAVPAIDPNSVSGEPEMVPSLDLPIKIKLDPELLLSIIGGTYSRVFDETPEAHFYMQAQKGVFTVWSKRDDYELSDYFHWEDFIDYDIDWSKASPTDSNNMPQDPQEEEKAVTIMSSQLTKDMVFFTDEARLEMGHGMPLKMVSETENGVKHSWIVPPRFPKDSDPSEIPERVIKDRAVV